MTTNNRLVELALKGLEMERDQIEQEIADLRRQLAPRGAASAERSNTQTYKADKADKSDPNEPVKRDHLTPAGRRKLSLMMTKRWAEKRRLDKASKRRVA